MMTSEEEEPIRAVSEGLAKIMSVSLCQLSGSFFYLQ